MLEFIKGVQHDGDESRCVVDADELEDGVSAGVPLRGGGALRETLCAADAFEAAVVEEGAVQVGWDEVDEVVEQGGVVDPEFVDSACGEVEVVVELLAKAFVSEPESKEFALVFVFLDFTVVA